MKPKQTLILFVIAAALLAAAYFMTERKEATVQQAAMARKTLFSGLTSATVERIEITPPDSAPVTLAKSGDAWYTNVERKHKADANLVTGLFAAISGEISGDVVSTNKDSFADFQVDETSGTRVKITGTDGKVLQEIFVGKADTNFFATFVRDIKGGEVLKAENAQLSYVFNKPEGWRDKKIVEILPGSIKELRGEGTSGTFELKKRDDVWRVTAEGRERVAQSLKVQQILAMMGAMNSTGFADEQSTEPLLAAMGLSPAKQKLTVVHEDRATSPAKELQTVILIGDFNEERRTYYAKRADAETLYLITEFQAAALAPPLSTLAEPDPPAAADGATTGSATTSQADAATTPTL